MSNPNLEIPPEIIKLKTLCEYVIPDRFQEIADFTRFEMCFKPLFANSEEEISIKEVFDFIVGKNRKYLTYTRFHEAYMKYKNNTAENNHVKIFFDKIMNSILKSGINSIGAPGGNEYISKNFINYKKYSISKLTLLCDDNKIISGIKLEFNGENGHKVRLAPINLNSVFELKLKVLKVIDQKHEIRDAITHIFGTINQNNYITFLGFKCVSGTMKCFGTPIGEGFLFGEYGKKLQCLNLSSDDDGINRMEFFFTKNQLMNDNFEIKPDKNIFDEDLIKDSNTEEENEKIKRTQLFGKSNSKCTGFDKAIVQTPLKYMKKEIEKNEDNGDDDDEEVDFTDKKTTLKSCKNHNETMMQTNIKFKLNNISQNPFVPLRNIGKIENISNPFFVEKKIPPKKNLFKLNSRTMIWNPKNRMGSQGVKSVKSSKSKVRDVERNFNNMKEDLISNIFDQVKQKLGGEIDMETQIVLDKLMNKKEKNTQKIIKPSRTVDAKDIIQEVDEEDKEDEEDKAQLAGFLIDKLGLKNDKGQANKIFLSILKKNEEGDEDKLKTIREEDENDINKLKKDIEKVEQDNKKETGENAQDKTEKALLSNIQLLSELNKFKVDKKKDKEEEEEEEEEENEDNEIEEVEEENIDPIKNFKKSVKFIENGSKYLKGNDLDKEERKDIEEAVQSNKMNLNNIVNEQNKLNRLSLKRANCIKIDNWEAREEEEREERMRRESVKLLKYFNEYQPKKDNYKYLVYKSFYSNELKDDVKIHFKQKGPKKLEAWKDDKFEADKKSLFDKTDKNCKEFEKRIKISTWLRPGDFTDFKNYTVFSENSPDINNIKQGAIDDCYFLSSVGALVEKDKNFIKNLFHITEKSYEHTYGINFIINGKPKLILVDDYFPCQVINDKNLKRVSKNFSLARSFENEIWVSLIEKAWAKVKGSYKKIDISYAEEAFEVLAGAYTKQIKIDKTRSKEFIWNILNDYSDYPMCAGTKGSVSEPTMNFKKCGLKSGHEYTILKVSDVGNTRRVMLRDPYGLDILGERCESVEDTKGIFWLLFDDFYRLFLMVEIAFFKPSFEPYYLKIKKEEATHCQAIKITNEIEGNLIFINVYQKQRQNNKTNNFYSYLMLVKEKGNNEEENWEQNYRYIDSISSLNQKAGYKTHYALNNITLKKGIYYLFFDINYRFFNEGKKNHSYSLRIFSSNKIDYKEIPYDNNMNNIFRIAIIDKIDRAENDKHLYKIEDKRLKDIKLKVLRNSGELPFDALLFKHRGKQNLNMKKIKLSKGKYFSFYNDDEVSESSKKIIKEIKPKESKLILVMHHDYIIESINLKNFNIEVFEKGEKGFKEENEETKVKTVIKKTKNK